MYFWMDESIEQQKVYMEVGGLLGFSADRSWSIVISHRAMQIRLHFKKESK